jgi:hypothetical protein
MTFPVLVQFIDGQFAATLVGAPDIRVTASTRAEALAALRATIQQRLIRGDLVALDVGGRGISGLAGVFRDDPTLREICDEAYQQRDLEAVE